jgi:hypothetical protein
MGKDSEMNNEPVAWMSNGKEFYVQKNYCPDFIPLYTHPVKELTDDEIEEFAYAFELWQLNNPDKALEGIKDFARAILKKASEK